MLHNLAVHIIKNAIRTVYCATHTKTWKTSRVQQGKAGPIFSHLVPAECIIETKRPEYPPVADSVRAVILCKTIFCTVFLPNSKLCQVTGMENSKPMGALFWYAVTTSPTPLPLLAMIIPLSLATTKHQNSTDTQVCVPRVHNSFIRLCRLVIF